MKPSNACSGALVFGPFISSDSIFICLSKPSKTIINLFGEGAIYWYRIVYIAFVFIGANAGIEAVWAFGDAALGFMTFPNLISIIFLTGALKKMTKKYFKEDYDSKS